MKHFIIIKLNDNTEKQSISQQVKQFFVEERSEVIVSYDIYENIVDRDNRYDLMIVLNLTDLDKFDKSLCHIKFKELFSKYFKHKIIFDIK